MVADVVAGGDEAAVDGSAIKKMWPLWLTTYMTTTIYQLKRTILPKYHFGETLSPGNWD